MIYTFFEEIPRYLEISLRNCLSRFFCVVFVPLLLLDLPIRKRLAALAADCSRLYTYVFEAFNYFAPYCCHFSALPL